MWRWSGAGEGRVDEENELKERPSNWVLAGDWLDQTLDGSRLQRRWQGARKNCHYDFHIGRVSWEAVYADSVCLCTGTASTGTGLVTSAALF